MRLAPAFLALALAAAACGGGGSRVPALDDASVRGDDVAASPDIGADASDAGVAGPPGPVPRITALAADDPKADSITVRYVLAEDDSAPIALAFDVSLDQGTSWRSAHGAASSLSGLASSPAGVPGAFTWDPLKDVGFRPVQAVLRLTPSTAAAVGSPATLMLPAVDRRRLAASRVDHYMIDYGGMWGPEKIAVAKKYQLVIIHASGENNITRSLVADLESGIDPADPGDDVLVLGYISIGEDLRTASLTDDQMAQDPRFTGDGTGPRIDPRGPDASGMPLDNIDPLGLPSNGGTGWASWFLNDNAVFRSPQHVGDGKPDRNQNFGGCFANAGDPKWFEVLDQMTVDSPDRLSGFRDFLSLDYGRALGIDGVFLDTIDTAAPNGYTDATSPNMSKFEWTAPGFTSFIRRLRDRYPNAIILQNRGLFFFDPTHPQYRFNAGGLIDFGYFESYRLDSNPSHEYDPYFYPDNRYNVAPKLMAEANRPGGFRVLSLGYVKDMPNEMSTDTLLGRSMLGLDSILEDIHVTQELAGFRHYMSDPGVELLNTFVLDHAGLEDHSPPVWTSTYNDHQPPFPMPPGEPTPRVGIQEAVAGDRAITVRWDVALDMHRVRYALYHQTEPFDFAADPKLSHATRVVLTPRVGIGYDHGPGANVYPHEADLTGLVSGRTYYLLIRAFDDSPAANEDDNRVTLSALPWGEATERCAIHVDGQFSDWDSVPVGFVEPHDTPPSSGPSFGEVKVCNDTDNLYVSFTSYSPFNLDGSPRSSYSRFLLFIDVDDDPTTGFDVAGGGFCGSEVLVNGAELYREMRGMFNAGQLGPIAFAPTTSVTHAELQVPLAPLRSIDPMLSRMRIVLLNDDAQDFAPDFGGYYGYTLR